MRQPISKILSELDNIKGTDNKVKHLRENDHVVIRQILQYMFDPKIKFLLPEGTPPYKPFQFDEPGRLWAEARRLYLFVEGGNPNLNQVRREQLWINLLEDVIPEDAELLSHIKDKKSPYKSLTPKLVEKAFPGLIS